MVFTREAVGQARRSLISRYDPGLETPGGKDDLAVIDADGLPGQFRSSSRGQMREENLLRPDTLAHEFLSKCRKVTASPHLYEGEIDGILPQSNQPISVPVFEYDITAVEERSPTDCEQELKVLCVPVDIDPLPG